MSEVLEVPATRVDVDSPDGCEFDVYLSATPKTRAELDALVEAVGGWGNVRLGSGPPINKTLFADVPGASVTINLRELIGPPPTPPLLTEIQKRIDNQLSAGA